MEDNRYYWTKVEDNVLIHNIKISADNVLEGCRKTAPLIGRTVSACQYRWYMVISKRGKCFELISPEVSKHNRKVTKKKVNEKNKKSNFIKRLFRKLFSK